LPGCSRKILQRRTNIRRKNQRRTVLKRRSDHLHSSRNEFIQYDDGQMRRGRVARDAYSLLWSVKRGFRGWSIDQNGPSQRRRWRPTGKSTPIRRGQIGHEAYDSGDIGSLPDAQFSGGACAEVRKTAVRSFCRRLAAPADSHAKASDALQRRRHPRDPGPPHDESGCWR